MNAEQREEARVPQRSIQRSIDAGATARSVNGPELSLSPSASSEQRSSMLGTTARVGGASEGVLENVPYVCYCQCRPSAWMDIADHCKEHKSESPIGAKLPATADDCAGE